MRSVWEILALMLTVATLGAVLSIPVVLPLLDNYFVPEKSEPSTVLIRAYVGQHGGFEPKIVRLKVGEKVRIVVEAMDLAQGFAIDEFGIDTGLILPEGGKKVVEFVPNKTGIFQFRNSIPAGPMTPFQVGYIIVEGGK